MFGMTEKYPKYLENILVNVYRYIVGLNNNESPFIVFPRLFAVSVSSPDFTIPMNFPWAQNLICFKQINLIKDSWILLVNFN